MKEDSRDLIVPIRMSILEKNKIEKRAKITGKKFSTFIRDSALGCEIKEKADEKLIREFIHDIRSVQIAINNLGRELHLANFINEPMLDREKKELSNLVLQIKEKLL